MPRGVQMHAQKTMAAWFEGGRLAVFEALTAACDTLDVDLQAELQERNQKLDAAQQELVQTRAQVAQAQRLESENGALRKQVAALTRSLQEARDSSSKDAGGDAVHDDYPSRLSGAPSRTHSPLSPKLERKKLPAGSDGDTQVTAGERINLETEVAKLRSVCAGLKRTRDEALAIAKKRKDAADKWAMYAAHLERKLKRSKKKSEPHIAESPVAPIVAKSGTWYKGQRPDGLPALMNSPPRPSPISSVVSAPGITSFTDGLRGAVLPALENTPELSRISPRRALSAPVDSVMDEGQAAQQNPPSSTQGDDTGTEAWPDDSTALPTGAATTKTVNKIKEEPSSDGPEIVSERCVGKRKRVPQEVLRHRAPLKTEEGSDPLITGEAGCFVPQASLDLDEGQMEIATPKRRRFGSPSRHGHGRNTTGRPCSVEPDDIAASVQPGDEADLKTPATVGTSDRNTGWVYDRAALFPISANQRLTKTHGIRQDKMGVSWRLDRSAAKLADDGHKHCTSSKDPGPGTPSLTTESRMLQSLLDSPPPGQGPVLQQTVRKSRGISSSHPTYKGPQPRALPFERGRSVQGAPAASEPKRSGQAVAPLRVGISELSTRRDRTNAKVKLNNTPLRERPLSSLKLEDFKINAEYNQGENFAFAEVVRNRSDRQSLEGCTDPQCCGKHFRALALSERKAAGPAMLDHIESVRLLEAYLGDQADRLGSMSTEEKEAAWLEAKTGELANKFGKHRQRFHRRTSPPGFWNADFPSTQEEQRDRAEGEKIERTMVQERYRDAMRGGGRWLFRDE